MRWYSPEMVLLDTLIDWDVVALSSAWWTFGLHEDQSQFERACRAITMQVTTRQVEMLRGPDAETAVPVADWELRFILADPDNWCPPDSEPRFWLRLTEEFRKKRYDY